jgi:hypothetical protein
LLSESQLPGGAPAAALLQSPFFIVGCGRSGTTLLRTMLNHHPDLAIPVESMFVIDFLRARTALSRRDLARLLLGDREFQEWNFPVAEASLAGCATAREMIDRLHELLAAAQHKRFWGQKTPRFIRHGELLKRHYPQARFIHVVRDPRAVVDSLIRSNVHYSNAYYAARRWLRDTGAGRALQAAYPRDVLEVRYEDLVSAPEPVLRRVCGFLGLPYSENMLAYSGAGLSEYSAGFGQIHALLNESPRPDRREAWRRSLSARDTALVEAVCREQLGLFGYAAETPAHPPEAAYVRWLKLQRVWNLARQVLHYLVYRRGPLLSFIWRKFRLGLLWTDLADVNF